MTVNCWIDLEADGFSPAVGAQVKHKKVEAAVSNKEIFLRVELKRLDLAQPIFPILLEVYRFCGFYIKAHF